MCTVHYVCVLSNMRNMDLIHMKMVQVEPPPLNSLHPVLAHCLTSCTSVSCPHLHCPVLVPTAAALFQSDPVDPTLRWSEPVCSQCLLDHLAGAAWEFLGGSQGEGQPEGRRGEGSVCVCGFILKKVFFECNCASSHSPLLLCVCSV